MAFCQNRRMKVSRKYFIIRCVEKSVHRVRLLTRPSDSTTGKLNQNVDSKKAPIYKSLYFLEHYYYIPSKHHCGMPYHAKG